MVNHELLRAEGILIIRPVAALEASDFQSIAQEVDPYIASNGKLHGVMIDAKGFPGWKDPVSGYRGDGRRMLGTSSRAAANFHCGSTGPRLRVAAPSSGDYRIALG